MKQSIKARTNCSFPGMIHQCLLDIDELARRDPQMRRLQKIVSWENEGRAFRIQDKKAFETLIMPVWFVRLKYNSFLRQLSQFGFKKIYHDKESARKGGKSRLAGAMSKLSYFGPTTTDPSLSLVSSHVQQRTTRTGGANTKARQKQNQAADNNGSYQSQFSVLSWLHRCESRCSIRS